MRALGLIAVLLAVANGSGCTARQLGRDGNNFRVAVCDLYTEQAMDNLIRARTYQPFVQLTYRDLLAQTTDRGEGTIGATTGLDRETGPLGGIGRKVASGLTGGAAASRERQLSFQADPVIDRPEVYEAYLQFAHDPGLFVESVDPPTCPVHIHRKRHKKHYWVPCEAGPMFQAMVLRTSFQPPGEAPVSPAYDVTIEEVAWVKEVDPENKAGRKGLFTVVLKLKESVPNGDGTLVLTLPGDRHPRVEVLKYLPGQAEGKPEGKEEGLSTEYIQIQYRPAEAGVEPGQLQGVSGRLFSFRWPKVVAPAQPNILQKLYADVNRIRANTRPSP